MESLADYMQEVNEEAMAVPARMQFYIDWEAMGRDAELSGDIFSIATGFGEVHLFAAR